MKCIKVGKNSQIIINFHRNTIAFPLAFNACKLFVGVWFLCWSFEFWFGASTGTEIKPIQFSLEESLKISQGISQAHREIARALIIPKNLILGRIKEKRKCRKETR